MNKFYLILILSFSVSAANKSQACVDYWTPPALDITIETDTGYYNLLVRIGGMQLFGGPAGHYCTCSLSSLASWLNEIDYVMFVDSGQYTPIEQFDVWDSDSLATEAWNDASPADWTAFVSEAIDFLPPGEPVDLLIRANLPNGYSSAGALNAALQLTFIGTDAWSSPNLAFGHHSLYSLGGAGSVSVATQGGGYFEWVDSIVFVEPVITSNPGQLSSLELTVFPNPSNDQIRLQLSAAIDARTILVRDITGKAVAQVPLNSNLAVIRKEELGPGIFLASVIDVYGATLGTKRIVFY